MEKLAKALSGIQVFRDLRTGEWVVQRDTEDESPLTPVEKLAVLLTCKAASLKQEGKDWVLYTADGARELGRHISKSKAASHQQRVTASQAKQAAFNLSTPTSRTLIEKALATVPRAKNVVPRVRVEMGGNMPGSIPISKAETAMHKIMQGLRSSPKYASILRKLAAALEPKDKLPGGEGDNMPDAAFTNTELTAGEKHEKEHTKDPALSKEIAKDHLAEDPSYYSKLKNFEAKKEAGSRVGSGFTSPGMPAMPSSMNIPAVASNMPSSPKPGALTGGPNPMGGAAQ